MNLFYSELRRIFCKSSLPLLWLIALLLSSITSAQTITTNKVDYFPGDRVLASGKGWGPFEVIDLKLTEHVFNNLGDAGLTEVVTADASGSFSQEIYTVVEADRGAFFHLLATGRTSRHQATITFNDAGGDYGIDFSAYDPDTYNRFLNGAVTAPIGRGSSPLGTTSHGSTVESLQPSNLGLGQIVAFEYFVRVDAAGACPNDEISIDGEWRTETTNGGAFGFDGSLGVIGAFVDTGADASLIDGGTPASVSNIAWTLNGDTIESTINVNGMDPGDEIIVEVWLVLQSSIPPSVGGNVQTRLVDAEAIGTCEPGGINTGSQTVPLLQVGDFFTADVDISVAKSDDIDPIIQGQTLTYTITGGNAGPSVANQVVVYDVLDPNVTFSSASDGGFINTDPGDAIPDGAVQWNVGVLSPGDTFVYTLSVTVNGDAPFSGTSGDEDPCDGSADLENNVTIATISDDTDLTNNEDCEPTNVLSSFVCPTLSNETADFETCEDSQGQTLSVQTDVPDIAIEFYIFPTQQSNPYGEGGTQLGSAVTPSGGVATSSVGISGLAPGTYYAYAVLDTDDPDLTDPNCRPFSEIIIEIIPLPATPVVEVADATCDAPGTATITNYDAALTYTFDPAGPTVGAGGVISGFSTDTAYTVTASTAAQNGESCTSDAANFNVAPRIEKRTPSFDPIDPICQGDYIAQLPTVSLNGIPGSWSPAVDNTQTTEYTFTPAAGECANPTTLTIVVNEKPEPHIDEITLCAGESYTWPVNQVTYYADNGSTRVCIKGENCEADKILKLIVPEALTCNIKQDKLATDHRTPDGVATVHPMGGTAPFTYHWDNGETTQTAYSLTYGLHTVTVTDANGCETSCQIDIAKELYCWTTLISNVTVYGGNDGVARVQGNGGYRPYSYEWDDGTIGSENSGLTAGTHYVTITDATGATSQCSVHICQPDEEVCDGMDNDNDGKIDEGFDQDNDGVADCFDDCDDRIDSDNDGVPDCIDKCAGFDDALDADGDGIPDACDNCDDGDDDGDGVKNCDDICPAGDDTVDTDGDGTPDACDTGNDDGDDDGDGVKNCDDICPAGDDTVDTDGDGTPDACDTCNDDGDDDGDGVKNCDDICPAGDDTIDTDGDGTPDACDTCNDDGDDDGDGVKNCDDICPAGDDTVDTDGDGTPDACDTCNDDGDDDGDGVKNCDDICPAGDDTADTDGDGTPDACDTCNDDGDDDGDGVKNCDDICPAGDDTADTDGDGTPDACDVEVCDGVDNDGDGDIDEGLNCNTGSIDKCETAFAKLGGSNAICFEDIAGFNSPRWGWTNLIPATNGTTTMDLYAAAGQCDITKGALIGEVEVTYNNGSIDVTVSTVPGVIMNVAHLYAGTDQLPTGNNGSPTVAPGQYPNIYEPGDEFTKHTFTGIDVSNAVDGFFVILHANVCPEGTTVKLAYRDTMEVKALVPFKEELHLNVNIAADAQSLIQIFDSNGRMIKNCGLHNLRKGENNVILSAGDIASGMYFVRLSTGSENMLVRVLRE